MLFKSILWETKILISGFAFISVIRFPPLFMTCDLSLLSFALKNLGAILAVKSPAEKFWLKK